MAKSKSQKKKPAAPRVTRGGKRVVSDPELILASARQKTKAKGKAIKVAKVAKAVRKAVASQKVAKPKPGPRSQPLPGMEQVTNRILNNACETIAEGRGFLSRGRDLEKEGMGIALQEMQRRGITGYRHDGVELAFVPGVDKLRVRMTEDAEHATGAVPQESGGPEPSDLSEGDAGEGEDGGIDGGSGDVELTH